MGEGNWVVLFVRTGSELSVANALKRRLDETAYVPFVPTRELGFVKKGVVQKVERSICFRGYVFIKASGGVEDFYRDAYRLALSVEGVYYFLCYGGDKRDIFVRKAEIAHLTRLMNDEFCMDASLGFMEGDRVKVISGALKGLESCIKKVIRAKRQAVIEMSIMGEVREITLMLELLKKGE